MTKIIRIGTVCENINHDYGDCEIAEILNETYGVLFLKDKTFTSYAGVVAGLSLNPTITETMAPLYFYKKKEFLKIYQPKSEEL